MSQMEYHTGTAIEIFPKGKSFSEKVSWLEANGYEIEEWDEDYIYSETVIFITNKFFKIHDTELDGTECIATKQKDDSYKYSLAWYNGGGGFDEILEMAIEKCEEDIKNEEN